MITSPATANFSLSRKNGFASEAAPVFVEGNDHHSGLTVFGHGRWLAPRGQDGLAEPFFVSCTDHVRRSMPRLLAIAKKSDASLVRPATVQRCSSGLAATIFQIDGLAAFPEVQERFC
jgi:hypothetical protein